MTLTYSQLKAQIQDYVESNYKKSWKNDIDHCPVVIGESQLCIEGIDIEEINGKTILIKIKTKDKEYLPFARFDPNLKPTPKLKSYKGM